jgi:hypothetical protein
MTQLFNDRRDDTQYPDHLNALHGAGDSEALFKGGLITGSPWPQQSRRKDVKDYDQSKVASLLSRAPSESDFREFDPRSLHATQPSVTRGGVEHYLTPDYERTGRTYADQGNVGNRHPVVYTRTDERTGKVQNVVLSGHHRAAAALLQGKQFKARHIEGGFGGPRG